MSIYLGNTKFEQVRERLGYLLTDDDKELWYKYQNDKADLSGMEECFHVFDIPKAIHFKGEAAKEAILKIFHPDKLVEPKGTITVGELNNPK